MLRNIFFFGALAFCSFVFAEDSQIYIKVGEAKVKKSLLAFPNLQYLGNSAAAPNFRAIGVDLFQVISNDLNVTNYFQMIEPKAFLEDPDKTSLLPAPGDPKGFKFESWREIGAEFLIRVGYSIVGNQLTLETYTYSVSKGQLIFGQKYQGTTNLTRKIAHSFCNDLLKALTGQKGMFLSKIVVSSDKGTVGKERFREIFIMDWDSANPTQVTNHQSIAVSPAWSPDGKKIAYTAFVKRARTGKRNPDLFIFEPSSGKRWHVSYRDGMNSGVAFAPDNEHMYITISLNKNPDIFLMTTDGTLLKNLTNGPREAMNVEPAVSSDGKQIAFSSDRAGKPMVYVMNSDGSNIERKTLVGKYNASPSWSPDKSKIVFASQDDDHFDIFVMDLKTQQLERLTSAKKKNGRWADNEDPVFSTDGRFVMFTSNRSGHNQIYITGVDGSNERAITNDKWNYYKPRWSGNVE